VGVENISESAGEGLHRGLLGAHHAEQGLGGEPARGLHRSDPGVAGERRRGREPTGPAAPAQQPPGQHRANPVYREQAGAGIAHRRRDLVGDDLDLPLDVADLGEQVATQPLAC